MMNADHPCARSVRQIMDIFGGKWSFAIICELHSEPKRFNEIRNDLGISTKSLSDVLKNLEANGVVTRTVHSAAPITVEYALTEKGSDFEQVFIKMSEWGMKWLNQSPPDGSVSHP